MPPGGVPATWGASSTSVVGKAKLASTPTRAAPKVPIRYSSRIGRTWVSLPWRWLATAEATRTKTSPGATALSAEMNTSPSRPAARASSGATRASAMPQPRPMAICSTRLVRKKKRETGLAMDWFMMGEKKKHALSRRGAEGGATENAADQRSGMGSEAGTGTAVTLFCGLPSMSLSL